MNENEAIKILSNFNECVTVKAGGAYETDRYIQAKEVAIKALEKRIPKKPHYDGDDYAPDGTFVWDEWLCPNCNSRYEVDYDDYGYCPVCGQRLDWSEEDER